VADVHVNIEQQVRIREQVIDKITNISPKERPFLAAIGKRDATNTKVEWVTDTLAAASASNQKIHGFAVTFAAADWSARTQEYNYTQLLSKQASVDMSHEAVDKVGIGRGLMGELNYQKKNKLDELTNDVEATLLSNNTRTQPLPNSDQAGICRGAQGFITTNHITVGSGDYPERTLEQTYFDDLASKCLQQGGYPSKGFGGIQAKRAVAGWVDQVNRPVSDSGKKLTNVVNQYETVTGMMDIIYDRHLSPSVFLMIEPSRFETAWLREPRWYWVSGPETVQGDFYGGYYATEMCLVSLQEKASGKITNLNYTI
jgi:hypothetical protein